MSKTIFRLLLLGAFLTATACSKKNDQKAAAPAAQSQVQDSAASNTGSFNRVSKLYQDHTCFKPLSDQFGQFANENMDMDLYDLHSAKVTETRSQGKVTEYTVVLPARPKKDPRRLVMRVSSDCEILKYEKAFRTVEELAEL